MQLTGSGTSASFFGSSPFFPRLRPRFLASLFFRSSSSAAKNIHHVCVGGLLEHTLSTARLCEYLTTQYESLDSDLLITMAILHDIGKVKELEGSPSINYTEQGNLLGHITLGIQMVGERIGLLPDFPPNLRHSHCSCAI